METNKSMMPIIGLKQNCFGYINIINNNGYHNGYQFVFCDEKGEKIEYEIEGHLILAVHEHYYSTDVSMDTKNVIVINSQKSVVTIGGYHFKRKCIQEIYPIGTNGLAICSNTIINEDKFGSGPHLFHPVNYLNLKDSPHILDLQKLLFNKEIFYLFSIENFHFVVNIANGDYKDPNKFTYHLIDEYGNIEYTWNNYNQLKCIWRRDDGSFTIFSVSECDEECHDWRRRELYDKEQYSKLCLVSIMNNCPYKEIKETESTAEDMYEDCLYNLHRNKKIERVFVIKSDFLKSLDYKLGYNDGYCINLHYSNLFCDNKYFIIKHSCGFTSFDANKMLMTMDFSNIIPIDKWDYVDCDYEPAISNCQYGNGLVGLQLMKAYTGECDPEDCPSNYNKNVGDYRLYDVFGNCVGKLDGDIITTPINSVGISQYCGVINKENFSLIIPPIFKEIVPLDRYIVKKEIKKDSSSVGDDNEDHLSAEKFLYEYEVPFSSVKIGVIEDKQLYIVRQEIGYNGRIQQGLFDNQSELIPVGNYDIKKVSGKYVLAKDSSHSLYTLYFHSGNVLYEDVVNVEVINLYNVKVYGKSWEIQHSEIVPLLHFSKIYKEKGFLINVDDKCLINDIILEMTPVFYTINDAFFKATLENGKNILFSIKNGVLVSDEGEMVMNSIFSAFNGSESNKSHKRKSSHVTHIIKFGEELSPKIREKINGDLWGHSNHPYVHLNYDSKDAVLIKENDRYFIARDNRNDDSSSTLEAFRKLGLSEEEMENLKKKYEEDKKKQAIDPSKIVDGVSFIGAEDEDELERVVHVVTNNEKHGYYSLLNGWLVKPQKLVVFDIYDNYLVFNKYVIDKKGKITYFNDILKYVNKAGQNSAYLDSSQNKYIIIDSDGEVYKNLLQVDPGILVNNSLGDYDEYQLTLNVSTKELKKIYNSNYKRHDDALYCPDPNEWTDEDAWDAMTDGQYGDYPGSGWDPEQFGY